VGYSFVMPGQESGPSKANHSEIHQTGPYENKGVEPVHVNGVTWHEEMILFIASIPMTWRSFLRMG
jgi:hypothetical protein